MKLTMAPTTHLFVRPLADRERAFTMVELIVAMILGGLLAAGIGTMLIQLFSGSRNVSAAQVSTQKSIEALEALRADLLVARSADREPDRIRDPGRMKDAIAQGLPVKSDRPSDNGRMLDVRDVLTASSNQLRFRADVDAGNVGQECVEWVAAAAGTQWSLVRNVYRNASCGGGASDSRTMLGPQRVDRSPARLFTYELVCDRGDPVNCAGSAATPAQPCRSWTVAGGAIGAPQLNWIVGVGWLVNASSEAGGAIQERSAGEYASIRSRESGDYRRALGC